MSNEGMVPPLMHFSYDIEDWTVKVTFMDNPMRFIVTKRDNMTHAWVSIGVYDGVLSLVCGLVDRNIPPPNVNTFDDLKHFAAQHQARSPITSRRSLLPL